MAILRDAERLESTLVLDKKFNRVYTSLYSVITDKDDSPIIPMSAPGLPGYGTAYAWNGSILDNWAFANHFSSALETYDMDYHGTAASQWTVTVNHSSERADRDQQDSSANRNDNPLLEPPILRGSFMGSTREAFRDKDDNPIVNTAIELFDPMPIIDDSIDTLYMEYNTATINLAQRTSFRNKVNSVAMWGLEPRQIKLARWAWDILFAGSLPYVRHQFEFHISDEPHKTDVETGVASDPGWRTTIPNVGMRYRNDAGDLVSIQDVEDNATMKPYYLTSAGAVITAAGTETYKVFEIEHEKDFHEIPGMPDPLPGPFV